MTRDPTKSLYVWGKAWFGLINATDAHLVMMAAMVPSTGEVACRAKAANIAEGGGGGCAVQILVLACDQRRY